MPRVPTSAALPTIRDQYPQIATELLTPILDLLTLTRGACGGDIDKFLILLVVAVRTTLSDEFRRYSPAQLLSGEVPVFPSLGVNIQSIADSIGAPKETVRRKVTELVASGWIERRRNDLFFTARGFQDLAPVRERIEEMAAHYHDLVGALLNRRES